jgi:NTP pyrophosphatase (non-canonical NTP hydrolase)
VKTGQFLLLKLMEECSEVAQRASKQIQFGKLEVQNGQSLTNAERLKLELLDLVAVAILLQRKGELPEFDDIDLEDIIEAKRLKMMKYLKMSHGLGELPEIVLPELPKGVNQ